jgi:hypothetical protein
MDRRTRLVLAPTVDGLDPAGEPLDPSMPHWQMGEEILGT